MELRLHQNVVRPATKIKMELGPHPNGVRIAPKWS